MRTTSSGTSAAIASQRPSTDMRCSFIPRSCKPVQCKDRHVGPRRAIESDAPPHPLHARGDRRFVRAGDDETAAMHVEMQRDCVRRGACPPSNSAGTPASRYRREHSGCSRTPSATWPATRSIASPTAAMVDGHHRQAGRLGGKIRCHQRQLVVGAVEIEFPAGLPAPPHRPQRSHVVAQPWGGRCPGDAEAALVVALHLAAQPQHATSVGVGVQVPGLLRQYGRAARKRHRNGRRQFHPLRRQRRRRRAARTSRAPVPPSSRASKPAASAACAAGPASRQSFCGSNVKTRMVSRAPGGVRRTPGGPGPRRSRRR